MKKTFFLFPVLLFGLLTAWRCEDTSRRAAAKAFFPSWPGQRELYRVFREQRSLLVVYGSRDSSTAAAYRSWAEDLASQNAELSLLFESDTSVGREELAAHPVLVVGTPAGNRLAARLRRDLPLRLEADELEVDGYTFHQPGALYSLGFYPSPFNRQLPLFFLTGLSDPAVLLWLRGQLSEGGRYPGLPGAGYAVWLEGRRVLLGAFADSSWTADAGRRFAFTEPERELWRSPNFRFIGREVSPGTAALDSLISRSEAAAAAVAAFTGAVAAGPPVDYFLYPSTEIKGLMTGRTEADHLEEDRPAAHAVLNEIYAGHFSGEAGRLLLRRRLGTPAVPALERGLAVYFTKNWQGCGYRYWAARLYRSGNLLPLEWVLEPDAADLPARCLAASFVAFLIERWGRESFLERYGVWKPDATELARLGPAWHSFLARLEEKETAAAPASRPGLPPFLRGFNFTHEGYQIYNGYGSRRAAAALDRLRELDANAVAIVPYSWMEDPRLPAPIPVAARAGSEDDAAAVRTLHDARLRGFATMVKPQIWLSRGSWPGEVEMSGEEDWRRFFAYYHRWIAHYAMLAEIHSADVLCVGTELSRAAMLRPEDWRRLIRQLRGLFSGSLTYAANWGEEFEQLAFWDELDLLGLNWYYPLSDNPHATPQELAGGVRRVAGRVEQVARRANKPLLLTEVGFSSVEAPWTMPYSDGYDRSYSEAHQRQAYQAIFSGLQDKSWLNGVFWWKWPTDLTHRGRDEGKDFAPNGKEAEKVVEEWFEEQKNRVTE